MQIAVGCLLHLGNEAWPILQGMLEQAPSPAHARRALVMGLKASALKVRIDSITCLSLLILTLQFWDVQTHFNPLCQTQKV